MANYGSKSYYVSVSIHTRKPTSLKGNFFYLSLDLNYNLLTFSNGCMRIFEMDWRPVQGEACLSPLALN